MGPWDGLGQAANIAQLAGLDAFGLISMIVQAALMARRHRDICQQFAQHVELVGSLLQKLQIPELMQQTETRRPLEQLQDALRRSYLLVRSCQDRSYLYRLFMGAKIVDELRQAQDEIDFYIRLIPLIALVDSNRATEEVPRGVTNCSNLDSRLEVRVSASVGKQVQGVIGQPLAGKMNLHEQKLINMEEAIKLCSIEESCPGFRKFDFSEMVDATDNFSDKCWIGQGGFGKVYKGRLPDGLEVAVKRPDEHSTLSEVKNEIQLARLQHTNIVTLLGWCIHGEEVILVYEFMQKGSLERFIFDKTRGALLSWSTRLQIIQGIARGLVYLHKHSRLRIVHGDLKPSNILLDCEMNPRIADFGSAKILSSDATEGYTNRVVGTNGYMAPEYVSRGNYSIKSDVFSFGVLLLGIISGQRNMIPNQHGDIVGDLVGHAWHLWKDGRLRELVDPLLGDGYQITEITRYTQVALLCVQDDPADRPTMSDVVTMLNSENVTLSEPKQPANLNMGGTNEEASSNIGRSCTTVDITITSSAPISTRVRIIVAPDGL